MQSEHFYSYMPLKFTVIQFFTQFIISIPNGYLEETLIQSASMNGGVTYFDENFSVCEVCYDYNLFVCSFSCILCLHWLTSDLILLIFLYNSCTALDSTSSHAFTG